MAASASSILAAAVVNVAAAIAFLALFSLLRRWRYTSHFYNARVGCGSLPKTPSTEDAADVQRASGRTWQATC
jgi:hypothetical protein